METSDVNAQSGDTHAEAEAAWIAMLREAKPHQKFAQVRSLSQTVLSLSRRAISRKNPHLDETSLRCLFVRYQYGEALAEGLAQYLRDRSHEAS